MNQKIIWIILALLLFTGGVVYLVSFLGGKGVSITIDPSGVDGRNEEKYTQGSRYNGSNADVYSTNQANIQSQNTNNAPISVNTGMVITPPGLYDTYDSSRVAEATGRVVLFFHSAGCSSCENLEKDLLLNRLNIPTGLTILDVDFENGTEFKEKYGVIYNHTLVEIDNQGNLIKKWTGSSNLSDLLKDLH